MRKKMIKETYGNKMSTLESIGISLPFLTAPRELLGRELTFHVDNMSVVYGWENKGLKNDASATIFLRAIFLISNYLGATVHITHVPRMSEKWTVVADSLTREKTTSESVLAMLSETKERKVRGILTKWISNPEENWSLPELLLKEVENLVKL
jgi:hypothetical protein